jgi:putative spermidine/putrescine transport system substrate-binding protein
VGVNDAAEVVNKVLGEAEAGQDEGTVDLIWINGENFRSMKQGGLLFCGYTDALPNMQYVNQDDPTIAFDFGTPVDGCEVPWNRAQFAMIYNEAFVDEPPRTMDALLQWVEDNPGRFAYPAPPDFTGSVFVRHVFYNEADKLFADEGGYEVLLGEFDQAIYDQVAAATWETLNAIEPSLWREGNTYPNDKTQLDQLFANTEIDFSLTYAPEEVGSAIENGLLPPTAMTYALDSGTIGNVNFVAIPYNAPNTAAAMVTANFLLSPEAQLHKAQPDVWGVRTVLDTNTLPEETAQAFAEVPRHPAVVSAEELTERGLPELQAAWLVAIEQGWVENVGEN